MIDPVGFLPPSRKSWLGTTVWLTGSSAELVHEWRLRLTMAGSLVVAPVDAVIACASQTKKEETPAALRLFGAARTAAGTVDILLVLDPPMEDGTDRWPIDINMTNDIALAEQYRDALKEGPQIIYLSQVLPDWRVSDSWFVAPKCPSLLLPQGLDGSDVQALYAAASELSRQRIVKGITPADDDRYDDGVLEGAAIAYLGTSEGSTYCRDRFWPWPVETFKPKGPVQDAVRGVAIGLAALSRKLRGYRAVCALKDAAE